MSFFYLLLLQINVVGVTTFLYLIYVFNPIFTILIQFLRFIHLVISCLKDLIFTGFVGKTENCSNFKPTYCQGSISSQPSIKSSININNIVIYTTTGRSRLEHCEVPDVETYTSLKWSSNFRNLQFKVNPKYPRHNHAHMDHSLHDPKPNIAGTKSHFLIDFGRDNGDNYDIEDLRMIMIMTDDGYRWSLDDDVYDGDYPSDNWFTFLTKVSDSTLVDIQLVIIQIYTW